VAAQLMVPQEGFSSVSKYYKCSVSAITHKLNVSEHMLWTFFLFLVYGTRGPKFVRTFQLHPVYYMYEKVKCSEEC
jgi:hypothetical protein